MIRKSLESEQPFKCEICGKPVPNFVPEFCCAGIDCNCQGNPIHPCVCSEVCSDALLSGIGTPMEERRIAAGIARWSPANPSADEEVDPIAKKWWTWVATSDGSTSVWRQALNRALAEQRALLTSERTKEQEEWQSFDKVHRAQIASLQSELQQLRSEIADIRADREKYLNAFHEQERENDRLEAELATAQKTIEALKARENDWEKTAEDLNNQLHALRSQLQTAMEERDQWKCSAQLYHEELRRLADGRKVETNLAHPVEEKIATANSRLEEAEKALKECHPANVWDKARMFYTHPSDPRDVVIKWHNERCQQVDQLLTRLSKPNDP